MLEDFTSGTAPLSQLSLTDTEESIARKVLSSQRISDSEALYLYNSSNLKLLSVLSTHVRETKSGKDTYFNKNFHIEPTNICIFTCSFCSYSRHLKDIDDKDKWELSLEQIRNIAKKYAGTDVTEAHIVGGVHPKRDVNYYASLIRVVKEALPQVHIKAFTAVELEVMFNRAKLSTKEGFLVLKEAGLNSIPGGGAEIFHPEIRNQICKNKASAETWLSIHEQAHKLDIPSNCTMLYGHIEKYEHRVDHLRRLRELQDKTDGFNTFIPLKFRHENNDMSNLSEVSEDEDLKNYAVSRLYLDNIPHIKAYWPMIGKSTTKKSLKYGVDDVDGTIDDSTKIYSMAGAEDQHPSMTTEELVALIGSAGYQAVERDSIYNKIRRY